MAVLKSKLPRGWETIKFRRSLWPLRVSTTLASCGTRKAKPRTIFAFSAPRLQFRKRPACRDLASCRAALQIGAHKFRAVPTPGIACAVQAAALGVSWSPQHGTRAKCVCVCVTRPSTSCQRATSASCQCTRKIVCLQTLARPWHPDHETPPHRDGRPSCNRSSTQTSATTLPRRPH